MNSRITSKPIMVLEDDRPLNDLIVRHLAEIGYNAVGVDRWEQAQAYLENHEPSLTILDTRLPDADGHELLPELTPQHPVIVLTAYGSIKQAVQAIRDGAAEYLSKPIDLDELELTVSRTLENASFRQDYQFVKSRLMARKKSFMVGHGSALMHVGHLIDAVAPTDTTVLIQGESGVGKEVAAREIHERSPRARRNFVALDCCTLQENLFESELFGHERGSFTGADRQKKGLIEGAEEGTLFLDEIGEVSPAIQAKLLRVLETGQFRRLGGTKDLIANVRVLVATNRNLNDLVQEGEFRSDLYYRLSAFTIDVPPLRNRREDIPDLVSHFFNNHDFSRRINKRVGGAAMQALMTYHWPGNVRELRNVVERAIIMSGDFTEIGPEHLGLPNGSSGTSDVVGLSFDHDPTWEDLQKAYLTQLLGKYSGHRSRVAKALGASERNTYRLIKKYGLENQNSKSLPLENGD